MSDTKRLADREKAEALDWAEENVLEAGYAPGGLRYVSLHFTGEYEYVAPSLLEAINKAREGEK